MIKHILAASRPKTLVAAIIPPIVAHGLLINLYDKTSYLYLSLCLGASLLIQLATNFYNDAVDAIKGADTDRVGPRRVSSSGDVSIKTTMLWGHVSIALASIIGVFLFLRGGPVVLVLGVLSLYLSYGYTGGPLPLAYKGLGELFVFLFFGLFAVCGSFYLYSLELPPIVFLVASQIGLLSTSLIMINNLRDRKTDKVVGKRTMATRVPVRVYVYSLYASLILPYLGLYILKAWAPLLALPLLMKVLNIIKNNKDGAILNEALKFAGIHLLVFGLALFGSFIS
ncbi:MAG: 1,4-dihydroxy-2-naphthoate octaprenyltransferase [Halobacteriovoraceae bacterium]|nr:1,4-dihydroxy-2-naphthoate octaprenyltransferase [Halobacteriovoraceae bacterium]|tara:strand:- start:58424 stop:59272 length:849 start_codon:yes stop_codon:yes gene_type:complete